MRKKYVVLSFLVLALVACSTSNKDVHSNDFIGYYKLQTISSSIAVDMNNNGIKTNNYLEEIKADYINYNGEVINFGYDNELRHNYASVGPPENLPGFAGFLDIRFPIQRIDSVFQGNDTYVTINTEYRKMTTGFIYIISVDTVEIEDAMNHFEYFDINNFSINRLNTDAFEILFDFKVYDFTENDWVTTELYATYLKMEE